jgi:hypothetical protein
MPEDDAETFIASAPIVITGGFVVEAAAPVTALWGFALEDAHNGASDGLHECKIIPCFAGLTFYANFLATGDAGGDNALAAADLGAAGFEIFKANVYPPASTAVWFVQDDATAKAAKMVSLRTDWVLPNKIIPRGNCAVGDINARVEWSVIQAVRTYDVT